MIDASRSTKDTDEMLSLQRPPIVLTTADRDSLLALVRDVAVIANSGNARFLREEVERADIAPDNIAPNMVVKMGSTVKFVDHGDRWIHRATLVFPDEAGDAHCVSILSPVGSALIGLGPGQSIRWTEQGRERSLAILEISAGNDRSRILQGKNP